MSPVNVIVVVIAIFILLALLLTIIIFRQARQRTITQGYIYISAEQVILINERVTQSHGLLRDRNALESALARPYTAAFYEQADVIRQAAGLIEGIAMNHPFIDGNKRTAMITGLDFLESNGYILRREASREIGQKIESLVIERNLEKFAEWLRSSIQRSQRRI